MTTPNAPFPTGNLSSSLDLILGNAAGTFSLQRWSIYGLRFALYSDHPDLSQLAADLMRCFPADHSDAPPDMRLCLTTGHAWRIPPPAENLPSDAGRIMDLQQAYGLTDAFARLGDCNYYELSPLGGVAYNMSSGQGLGYVRDVQRYDPWLITHLYMQMAVLELLRGQGLYMIHAGGVALDGRGVLLAGLTGSGKTTTTLQLVEGGFDFLSEDRMFVRSTGEGAVELLPFAPDVAITANTARLLPSLAARLPRQPDPGRKLELDPAALFPEAIIERALPALILFPRVTTNPRSEAQPISAAQGLQRILPHSLLASQADVSAANFDALSRLVAASRCYDLPLGPDVENLPALVRGLLEN